MLDHLIVDGYNVLHAWHRDRVKQKGLSLKGTVPDFSSARVDLLRQLELTAAQRGIHCTVVFDGVAIDDVLHASSKYLTVVFAGPRSSADHAIERMVCQRKERCGIVVVTNDHLQGNLVTGWGAHVWAASMLQHWLEEAEA